jgi:hypothetical protein
MCNSSNSIVLGGGSSTVDRAFQSVCLVYNWDSENDNVEREKIRME